MANRNDPRTTPAGPWLWLAGDALITVVAIVWLASGLLWTLLLWETIGLVYLTVGLAVVWRGSAEKSGSAKTARVVAAFSWILPLVSSLVGAYAAVVAVAARSGPATQAAGQITLAVAASVGVVISWALLNVGFAEIYQSLDESHDDVDGIEFPGQDTTAFLNYLYFSFTIGTAFATSDSRVMTLPIRRIVLIHSIVGFLFNALVVATAIQVMQQLVAG